MLMPISAKPASTSILQNLNNMFGSLSPCADGSNVRPISASIPAMVTSRQLDAIQLLHEYGVVVREDAPLLHFEQLRSDCLDAIAVHDQQPWVRLLADSRLMYGTMAFSHSVAHAADKLRYDAPEALLENLGMRAVFQQRLSRRSSTDGLLLFDQKRLKTSEHAVLRQSFTQPNRAAEVGLATGNAIEVHCVGRRRHEAAAEHTGFEF